MTDLTLYGIVIISSELELKTAENTNSEGKKVSNSVLNFAGRTVEKHKNKETGELENKANFFSFEIWDTGAEYLANNAKKGDKLVVLSATPKEHKWVKDGVNHSKLVFRINKFTVIPYTPKETV